MCFRGDSVDLHAYRKKCRLDELVSKTLGLRRILTMDAAQDLVRQRNFNFLWSEFVKVTRSRLVNYRPAAWNLVPCLTCAITSIICGNYG